jgi:hypothetical protein
VLCHRMSVRLFDGLTMSLSAGGAGVSQREIAKCIREHGGEVSNIVHRRVDLLVATGLALQRNTQAVRKAQKHGLLLVTPDFLIDSVDAGTLMDPADYPPDQDLDTISDKAPREGATPGMVGLNSGHLEVQVEMSDDPPLVWWPAHIGQATDEGDSGPRGRLPCSLTYLPLPERGYNEPTESRCMLDCECAIGCGSGVRRLWDLEEAIWRPWRFRDSMAAGAEEEQADPSNVCVRRVAESSSRRSKTIYRRGPSLWRTSHLLRAQSCIAVRRRKRMRHFLSS